MIKIAYPLFYCYLDIVRQLNAKYPTVGIHGCTFQLEEYF